MKKILLILSILLALFGLSGCENAIEPVVEITEPIPPKETSRWDEIVQRNELRIGVPHTDDSFDNALIDAFSKELGIPVTKVVIPWDEPLVDYLKENRVDMLWGQIPATSETSTSFRLSSPYFNSTILYIAATPDVVLEPTTVIGVPKNAVEEAMVKHYYDTVHICNTKEELFSALANGTCDVVLYEKALYEKLPQKAEAFHIIKEAPYELVVAFEQNNVSVCTEVEKILAKIKADGTASEICLAWYPVDLITK